jgi:hypothetical protein
MRLKKFSNSWAVAADGVELATKCASDPATGITEVTSNSRMLIYSAPWVLRPAPPRMQMHLPLSVLIREIRGLTIFFSSECG